MLALATAAVAAGAILITDHTNYNAGSELRVRGDGLAAQWTIRISDNAEKRVAHNVVQLTAERKIFRKKLICVELRVPVHQSAPAYAGISCLQNGVITQLVLEIEAPLLRVANGMIALRPNLSGAERPLRMELSWAAQGPPPGAGWQDVSDLPKLNVPGDSWILLIHAVVVGSELHCVARELLREVHQKCIVSPDVSVVARVGAPQRVVHVGVHNRQQRRLEQAG